MNKQHLKNRHSQINYTFSIPILNYIYIFFCSYRHSI